MAEGKKEERIRIKTPRGIAVYPRVNKPDTKFKQQGEYSIQVKCQPSPAVDALVAQIDEVAAAAYAEAKAKLQEKPADPKKIAQQKAALAKLGEGPKPYAPAYDEEGNETGEVVFKLKMNALITRKDGSTKAIRPDLFDAKAHPIKDPSKVQVWGGSEVIAHGELRPYYVAGTGQTGCTIRLGAVQIIKLVTGGRDGSYYGVEAVDDEEAFDASAVADETTAGGPTEVGAEDDDF